MGVVDTIALYKDYELNDLKIHALRGVSLSFEAGAFAAVAGPSGSGKSTFLHLVGCLDTPTAGSLSVDEREVASLSRNQSALLRRQKIGFIFQAYNLIPVLSALENVSLPLVLLGIEKKEARQQSLRALEEVGLGGMEHRRPKEMSGGQQQRVAIARALVKKPSLILADEPTANLDSTTGRAILDLMLALNEKEGTTFIFSTHDPMVMEFARRLIMLRDGMVESESRR
ncbi:MULTISPECIES: ABC transporter ATP-binding protein [Sediminispirochaeta]|uniref:ABC transporter related protein n=1 Tax=Sediminispirochaeta smaragdinae (strain DSM 11293 / JCM 15392 / SEBR 4228) TaxID=573413 RepID=E1R908_SEDSS|nr:MULTISPECIES: ABC transporter ATP-binding protein [Sediminispirochaeta]ADK82977.1 ABC transporter related protein [Sediminispirochaeta smaragdinae DSM 11293]